MWTRITPNTDTFYRVQVVFTTAGLGFDSNISKNMFSMSLGK